MQITNAGDKSAEVSALEEGCGTSQEQHLLVCSCFRDLTKTKNKLNHLIALT